MKEAVKSVGFPSCAENVRRVKNQDCQKTSDG